MFHQVSFKAGNPGVFIEGGIHARYKLRRLKKIFLSFFKNNVSFLENGLLQRLPCTFWMHCWQAQTQRSEPWLNVTTGTSFQCSIPMGTCIRTRPHWELACGERLADPMAHYPLVTSAMGLTWTETLAFTGGVGVIIIFFLNFALMIATFILFRRSGSIKRPLQRGLRWYWAVLWRWSKNSL